MITIPQRYYCVIENPGIKNKEERIEYDNIGQAKLLFADQEIRFNQEPFPLFPVEVFKN
jgi:major vault protein